MLEELEVKDLGPITQARLTPASGMTAITGETGAGKSMLLNAIGLISGAPAQSARVRPGKESSWAQGVFSLDEGAPALRLVEEAGFEPEDGQIFLARSVPEEGRSRSLLNGRTVPRSLLGQLSEYLVTIHGQSDQLRMASPAKQRDFLDSFAGDRLELEAYRVCWQQLQELETKLAKLSDQQAGAIQQADYLRESINRIDRVDPQPGEDESLKEQRERIEHAAQITQAVTGALAALDSTQLDVDIDAPSVAGLIGQASQSLASAGVSGLFEESIERLHSMNADLSDLVFNLSQLIDPDSQEGDLDKINARIHDLEELKGRWGPTIEDVLGWREQAQFDLEDMDASPERLQALQEECDQARSAALQAAQALSVKRAAAGKALGEQVSRELAALAMAGAGLQVRVRQRAAADLDAHGLDDVAFLFTPFPGSPQLPMGSSASGGELSRLMLAMELTAAQAKGTSPSPGHSRPKSKKSPESGGQLRPAPGERMTFIFDEVDAGVGGKAAVELGKRLAQLAQSAQVIVVTHLAQVASWADRQFVLAKTTGQDAASTSVEEVTGIQREQEIARMLAGSESQTSLDHARELLASSRL